ncbi:MAG TPA: ribosome recycling factor [Candidatus Saccharibacteria bacterium]|jgi:ribosome recycling factor|nr:ribosome recycling factor [Candidatus Saccharibacteria bacterium]
MDTSEIELKIKTSIEHLQEELKKVRTGRAHPDMISGLMVDAYGAQMPLNQLANVTTPEPQLLQISPFDPSNIEAISKAIRDNPSLGMNPSDDGRLIRVPIPPLTTERRQEMVKILGSKAEEARISIRSIRHDFLKDAKELKDSKGITEDDLKRLEKEITEKIEKSNKSIDDAIKAKEAEIMTV